MKHNLSPFTRFYYFLFFLIKTKLNQKKNQVSAEIDVNRNLYVPNVTHNLNTETSTLQHDTCVCEMTIDLNLGLFNLRLPARTMLVHTGKLLRLKRHNDAN